MVKLIYLLLKKPKEDDMASSRAATSSDAEARKNLNFLPSKNHVFFLFISERPLDFFRNRVVLHTINCLGLISICLAY